MPSIHEKPIVDDYFKLDDKAKEKYIRANTINKNGDISKKSAVGKLLNRWSVTRYLLNKINGVNFDKTIQNLSTQKQKTADKKTFNASCDFLGAFIEKNGSKKQLDILKQLKFSDTRPNPPPANTKPKPVNATRAAWEKLLNENPEDKKWFEETFTKNANLPTNAPVPSAEELHKAKDLFENPTSYKAIRQKPHVFSFNPVDLKLDVTQSLLPGSLIDDNIIVGFISNLTKNNQNPNIRIANTRAFEFYLTDKNPEDAFKLFFEALDKDFYSKGKLLIPIQQNNKTHYTLAMVDFGKKTISHLDSLGPRPGNQEIVKDIGTWMDYWIEKNNLPKINWNVELLDVPRQNNGCDCGAFQCSFMEKIMSDGTTNFDVKAEHMPFFRFHLLQSILPFYAKKE